MNTDRPLSCTCLIFLPGTPWGVGGVVGGGGGGEVPLPTGSNLSLVLRAS